MMTPTAASIRFQRSGERAFLDHGWLKTYHSFSFADYFDPGNVNWGALRVFNDDVIAAGKGFGTHPHRDMEILTYVFRGELEHKDSMGNTGVVRPGGVQYLSAGTGITHSEYNHSRNEDVRLVQMWVIPRANGLAPRYGQIDYTRDERNGRWLPIASGQAGIESKIAIWQDATAYVARLEETKLTHGVGPGRFAFLFVGDGAAVLNGEPLASGDAARIVGPFEIEIEAREAELVLWDLPALGQARG
jgi:redox-sensitive bicupin YhaK (pirin superfamily)